SLPRPARKAHCSTLGPGLQMPGGGVRSKSRTNRFPGGPAMPLFRAPELTAFVTRVFQAADVPADEAEIVSTSLVGANLRGHDSHGVMRVTQYVDFVETGVYRTGVALKVEHETPCVVTCDGQWGFGQVQAHRLLDLIIPKAQALGLAAGAARDCGHIGRLGEYAERAAEAGVRPSAPGHHDRASP